MKVAEGVQQLKVPMARNPLGYTFSYFIPDSGTLIDTGIPTKEAYAGLEKQLWDAGAKVTDVKRIIPTHFHTDHIGLVSQIQPRSGAELYAHQVYVDKQKEEQERWEQQTDLAAQEIEEMGGGDITQLFNRVEGHVRPRPKPFSIDRVVTDGEVLKLGDKSLRVFWTPGHAQEHICLYDADNRILFSGDHVLPKITSHIAMYTYQKRDPLKDYLSSLDKVKNLPVDIVLPGHEWTFTNLSERVDQLKAHHKARLDEVKDALHGGEKTIYQVSSRIHWDSRPWPVMDFWTKRMAATETYAHLVYLLNREEVAEEKREGILYYRLT